MCFSVNELEYNDTLRNMESAMYYQYITFNDICNSTNDILN